MARIRAYKSLKGEKLLMYFALALLCSLYLLFVGACENHSGSGLKEIDEGLYKTAQSDARKGDYNSALKNYLKLIDERDDSPQSHLEAGRIYLFTLKDYVYAIYHFKKFIEIQSIVEPNSNLIPNVRQMIETAQKRMITSLPQSPYEDNEGLESVIAQLKQENYELKQAISSYTATIKRLENENLSQANNARIASQNVQTSQQQSRPVATQSSQVSTHTTSQPANNRRIARSVEELRNPTVQRDIPDTYTVKAGDTLSIISQKVYGTKSRWNEIFRYNSSTLASPERLRVGQVLRLPR